MFSTSSLPSWYDSMLSNEKYMAVDKLLSMRHPGKEIEREDFCGKASVTLHEPNRDYYHQLYKQALRCIETSPSGAVSPPQSNYMRTSPPVSLCQATPPPPPPPPPPRTMNYEHSHPLPRTPPGGIYSTFPSDIHIDSHHRSPPPPPPPDFACNRAKGVCGWLMSGNKCEECDPHDMTQRNMVMHQKALFSTEFLMRQKEKWRRPRTVYTEKQLISLEKAYKTNKYLRGKERKELCKLLNLEERHIKVWYQNRRAKERGQIRHDKWLKKARKYSKKNGVVVSS